MRNGTGSEIESVPFVCMPHIMLMCYLSLFEEVALGERLLYISIPPVPDA